jgi:hypothetical protein
MSLLILIASFFSGIAIVYIVIVIFSMGVTVSVPLITLLLGIVTGFIASILAGATIGIAEAVISQPAQKDSAAVIGLIFGAALIFAVYAVFNDVALIISALISFLFFGQDLFSKKEKK